MLVRALVVLEALSAYVAALVVAVALVVVVVRRYAVVRAQARAVDRCL